MSHELDSCECTTCGALRRKLLRLGDTVRPIAPDREERWRWGDEEHLRLLPGMDLEGRRHGTR